MAGHALVLDAPRSPENRWDWLRLHKDIAFSQVTAAQLRRAIRSLTDAGQKTSAKEPPLVKKIRAVLSKAGLAEIGVRMRHGQVTLSGIDPQSFSALGKAIRPLGK